MDAIAHYFDHNASSPLCPEARDAMTSALSRQWGNPSSPHRFGHEARIALEEARADVATLIGAEPREITFVSGGTEADNLAIHGAARSWLAAGHLPGHLVTSAVEHPAVLAPCRRLADEGWRLTVVPVDQDCVVDAETALSSLKPDTALISVMMANNETGAVQSIAEIATGAKRAGVRMHTDAVQAVGRMPVEPHRLGVDYLSMSSHKMGGPVGVGALWIKDPAHFRPLLTGGSQESRRRPGTEPLLLAIGFAAAARAARSRGSNDKVRMLRDRMERELHSRHPSVRFNGDGQPRLCNTSSQTWPGLDNEAFVMRLDLAGFAVSTGSACSTGATRPSHVLAAMGRSSDEIGSTIRVSLGPDTEETGVDTLIDALSRAATELYRADTLTGLRARP